MAIVAIVVIRNSKSEEIEARTHVIPTPLRYLSFAAVALVVYVACLLPRAILTYPDREGTTATQVNMVRSLH